MKNVFVIEDLEKGLFSECYTNVKMLWEAIDKFNNEDIEPVITAGRLSESLADKFNKKILTYSKMITLIKDFKSQGKLVNFHTQPMERYKRSKYSYLTIRELVVKSKNKKIRSRKPKIVVV